MNIIFSRTLLLCIVSFLTILSIYTDLKVLNVVQELYKFQTENEHLLLSPLETNGAPPTTKLRRTTTSSSLPTTIAMTNVVGKKDKRNLLSPAETRAETTTTTTTTLRGMTNNTRINQTDKSKNSTLSAEKSITDTANDMQREQEHNQKEEQAKTKKNRKPSVPLARLDENRIKELEQQHKSSMSLSSSTTTAEKTETTIANRSNKRINQTDKSKNSTLSAKKSIADTANDMQREQEHNQKQAKSRKNRKPPAALARLDEKRMKGLTQQDKSSIPLSSTKTTAEKTDATITNNSNNHTATAGQDKSIFPPMVIDIVITGSNTKSEFYEAQRKTFGQHVMVRNFFVVTEDDDFERNCSSSLTKDDVKNVQQYCSDYSQIAAGKDQKLLAGLMDLSMPDDILSTKKNPAGWVCAQKRPVAGFVKAMDYYTKENPHESFPDFLIMLDDDSYINIDLAVEQLKKYKPMKDSKAVAGCMMPVRVYYENKYISNFDIPFGGFGTAFSRRMLNNFSRSLNCSKSHLRPFEGHACKQLQNNIMGEHAVFQDGMTMTDVMHKFATEDLFANYTRWTTANSCFHSDWYWGYFMNWYSHPAKQLFHLRRGKLGNEYFVKGNLQKFGVVPYKNSQYDFKSTPVTKTGQCFNDNIANCTVDSHFCHYVSPDAMVNITDQLKEVNPHHFKQKVPTVVGATEAFVDN